MTDAAGNFYNDDGNTVSTLAFGYTGASYAMEEAFYSKNGVPIERIRLSIIRVVHLW